MKIHTPDEANKIAHGARSIPDSFIEEVNKKIVDGYANKAKRVIVDTNNLKEPQRIALLELLQNAGYRNTTNNSTQFDGNWLEIKL